MKKNCVSAPMRVLVYLSVITLLGTTLAACDGLKKLYNEGGVVQTQFVDRVPFDRVLDLMIVPVEIRGHTYRFLFDTGAPMVISNELYEALGHEPLGERQVGDSQRNTQNLTATMIDSLGIGGVTFTHTAAFVADLTAAVEIKCLDIDGILGANLMRLAYWKLDPEADSISFSSDLSRLTSGLQDPISVPFSPDRSFKPYVSIRLDGAVAENFLFDTGSGSYVSMGEGFMDRSNVLATYYGLGSAGLYGSTMDSLWKGKTELGFGGFSQVAAASYTSGNARKILGMEFFKQFVCVLNWQDRRIDLYPQNIEKQQFSSRSVIPRWTDGQLIVGTMRTDGDPDLRGISLGDTIVAVGDKSFVGAGVDAYCGLILNSHDEPRDTLTLEMKDGAVLSFPRRKTELE